MSNRKTINICQCLFILLLLWLVVGILDADIKTVYLPENIKVEENATREIKVRNLSEQEIFETGYFTIVDDFIFFLYSKGHLELVKLDLKGNVIRRLKKRGEGPGEFLNLMMIREYKEGIAVLDTNNLKLLFYSKNFEFISEKRMDTIFHNFYINKKNEIVFFQKLREDHYFHVYSENALKSLRQFGKTVSSLKKTPEVLDFDSPRVVLYIPGKDGVWAAFRNRYDPRYYEKEKFSVEIKAPEGFFKYEEQEQMGRKYRQYNDVAVHLATYKNLLFYFFRKDEHSYCDIFDLQNFNLLKRILFTKNRYRMVSHWKEGIFYGLSYDNENEDNVILSRIEFDIANLSLLKDI